MTRIGGIAGERLRSFIDRIERLNEEELAVKADKREIFAEARANGFDPKTMRRCIAARAQDPDERDEQDHLFDLYMRALEASGTAVAITRAAREAKSESDEPCSEGKADTGAPESEDRPTGVPEEQPRGRSEADRQAHNLEVAGSTPAPATNSTDGVNDASQSSCGAPGAAKSNRAASREQYAAIPPEPPSGAGGDAEGQSLLSPHGGSGGDSLPQPSGDVSDPLGIPAFLKRDGDNKAPCMREGRAA